MAIVGLKREFDRVEWSTIREDVDIRTLHSNDAIYALEYVLSQIPKLNNCKNLTQETSQANTYRT